MNEQDEIVARKTMKEIKTALKNGERQRAIRLTNELIRYFGLDEEL